MKLSVVALALTLAGCAGYKLQPIAKRTQVAPDGRAIWIVMTDPLGDDHLLFCEAHEVPPKCIDATPRNPEP